MESEFELWEDQRVVWSVLTAVVSQWSPLVAVGSEWSMQGGGAGVSVQSSPE